MSSRLRNIYAKISFPVLGVLVVIVALSTYWQWKEKELTLTRNLSETAQDLNGSLDATLHHVMLTADHETLDTTLDRVGKLRSIKRVSIMDSNGKVFRSSDRGVVGKTETKQEAERINQSGKGIFELRDAMDGSPYLLALSPVLTEPACQACHKDVKAGDPIGLIGSERWATQEMEELKASHTQTIVVNLFILFFLGVILARKGSWSASDDSSLKQNQDLP